MENKRFVVALEIKKDIYVSAKNKTEARKKIQKRLSTQKGANFVSIDYVDESWMY